MASAPTCCRKGWRVSADPIAMSSFDYSEFSWDSLATNYDGTVIATIGETAAQPFAMQCARFNGSSWVLDNPIEDYKVYDLGTIHLSDDGTLLTFNAYETGTNYKVIVQYEYAGNGNWSFVRELPNDYYDPDTGLLFGGVDLWSSMTRVSDDGSVISAGTVAVGYTSGVGYTTYVLIYRNGTPYVTKLLPTWPHELGYDWATGISGDGNTVFIAASYAYSTARPPEEQPYGAYRVPTAQPDYYHYPNYGSIAVLEWNGSSYEKTGVMYVPESFAQANPRIRSYVAWQGALRSNYDGTILVSANGWSSYLIRIITNRATGYWSSIGPSYVGLIEVFKKGPSGWYFDKLIKNPISNDEQPFYGIEDGSSSAFGFNVSLDKTGTMMLASSQYMDAMFSYVNEELERIMDSDYYTLDSVAPDAYTWAGAQNIAKDYDSRCVSILSRDGQKAFLLNYEMYLGDPPIQVPAVIPFERC